LANPRKGRKKKQLLVPTVPDAWSGEITQYIQFYTVVTWLQVVLWWMFRLDRWQL